MFNKEDISNIIAVCEAIFMGQGVRSAEEARAILMLQAKARGQLTTNPNLESEED